MSTHVPTYPLHRFPALPFPAALLLITTAACVPGAELEPGAEADPSWTSELDDEDLSPIAPAGDQDNSCPTWDCNRNHPMLTLFPVPEINENGLPDDRGLRLLSFRQGFQSLRLDVDRGEIRGYHPITGALEVSDAGAEGTILTMADSAGAPRWRIRVEEHTTMAYWTGAGHVPVYRLRYQEIGGSSNWIDVCKEPADAVADPAWPSGFEAYALLISDERYDRDAKRVRDDVNPLGWFNIACAGTALAKMVLLHYDPHVSTGTFVTTPDQRTITLKMLTAAYLGATPFTVPGQPLQWEDASSWHTVPFPAQVEAVWGLNGAVCLDRPRLTSSEPDILTRIEDTCNATPGCIMPQTCIQQGITAKNWRLYGMWRTWSP